MNDDGETEHWEHWYQVVPEDDYSLRQGDLFRGLPVYWLSPDNEVPDEDPEDYDPIYNVTTSDWIVLTSSCDLEQERCPQVLIAEVLPASREELRAEDSDKVYRRRQEVLRRGYDPKKFLLAEFPEIDPPFERSFAAFWNQVAVPLPYLKEACGDRERLRLQCPFREKFGNWVGDAFAEVGPETEAQIPRITEGIFDTHILRHVED